MAPASVHVIGYTHTAALCGEAMILSKMGQAREAAAA
jgi:hypothetical protein